VTDVADRRRRLGPPLVLVGLVLAAWELYARASGVSPFVLPAPSDVLGSLWRFRDEAIRHSIPTVVETAVGFSASIAAAIVSSSAAAVQTTGWTPSLSWASHRPRRRLRSVSFRVRGACHAGLARLHVATSGRRRAEVPAATGARLEKVACCARFDHIFCRGTQ